MSDKTKQFTRLETLLGFAFALLSALSLFLLFKLQSSERQVSENRFQVQELRARGTWFEPLAARLTKERDTERQLRAVLEETCKIRDI